MAPAGSVLLAAFSGENMKRREWMWPMKRPDPLESNPPRVALPLIRFQAAASWAGELVAMSSDLPSLHTPHPSFSTEQVENRSRSAVTRLLPGFSKLGVSKRGRESGRIANL